MIYKSPLIPVFDRYRWCNMFLSFSGTSFFCNLHYILCKVSGCKAFKYLGLYKRAMKKGASVQSSGFHPYQTQCCLFKANIL